MRLVAYQGSINDGYFVRIFYKTMDQATSAMYHEDRGAYSLHDMEVQRLPIDDKYDDFVKSLGHQPVYN